MTTITTNADSIRASDEFAPLYYRHAGQSEPQRAALYIKADGTVTADINYQINCVTFDVWHGRTRTVELSPSVSGAALADWLDNESTVALLARVVAGLTVDWDGNNEVGRLTDDAVAALDELEREAQDIDQIEVWQPGDWLNGVVSGGSVGDVDLTDKTDSELAAIAEEWTQEAKNDGIQFDGLLLEVLKSIRQNGLDEREDEDEDECEDEDANGVAPDIR